MSSGSMAQSREAAARINSTAPERPALQHYAIGIGAYLAIALALTFPVLTDPSTLLISQWPLDTDHVLWIQWWFARAIESSELSLFHTDLIRFPATTNLHLADINLAINSIAYLIAKPLGLIASHNIMLWLSFVATGWLMWELGIRLSGDRLAGWLAGLAFAGSSYWVSCALNSWAYLVHIWVFPLAFLAVERAARGDGIRYRARDFAGLGAAVGLTFHVSPFYLLFLAVLCIALAPAFARNIAALCRAPGGLLCIAVFAATSLAIVVPRAIPMYEASLAEFAVHSTSTQTVLASELLEFVWPPAVYRPDRPEGGTFLVVFWGYTVPLVIACGLWWSRRRSAYWRWLGAAAVMFLLAMGPLWQSPTGAAIRLPEYWLLQLPGFSFITNHWRWSLPGVFCLAIAFSLALSDLFRMAPDKRRLAAAIVGIAFALESVLIFPFPWPRPLWTHPPDPISQRLRDIDSVEVILDFRHRAKINQLVHEKRIVGGWLPRVEVSSVDATRELMLGVRENNPDPANYLGILGIDAVIADHYTAFRIVPVRGTERSFEQVPVRARAGLRPTRRGLP